MRRTTPLTTAALLGLALLTPATAATAAGETCRGEAATIVGTGPTVTGTEGRDVIVTASAGVVDALGGDDLICVTGPGGSSNLLSVDAGAGDDVVDTTAAPANFYVTTVLGGGADTFAGGPASDTVYAGEQARTGNGGYTFGADTEKDTIDTGEGDDAAWTGAAGTPNRDAVRLGVGTDRLYLGAANATSDAVLDGGDGLDGLRLTGGSGDLTLDMARGTFTSPQGTAAFTSFEFTSLEVGTGTVAYRGTEGDDDVTLRPTDGVPTLDVTTGGGDDDVTIEPATAIGTGSRIDTGAGTDTLVAATETGRLALDLATQRFGVGGVDAVAVGLEDAFLMAPEVVMNGDDGDNELRWNGCDATLRGGLGDDYLGWQFDGIFEFYKFDCTGEVSMNGGDGRDTVRGSHMDDLLIGGRGHDTIEGRGGDDRIRGSRGNDEVDGGNGRDRVSGGAGNDVLKGRSADDVLIGGPGRDRVDGSNGRDRCVAERKARCER
jgi:Ca2+-binding RTX toxin-like protein